ncbi:hypothetical protein EIN_268000 [Entamoeba invadens IP1]|uniref:VASt domain-containing protein n=1 Tax=Entamoeba invadens IP1 TaxID=370355 RepID=A0A0A1U808_ENTIV|nr:hypothetical protein EIN_268000 [Entamoeba invadens IP1]ELP91064.1 hypothetical protein EIN_268000 [Entamoeba invadens IP1]|eukprot:XP_004257835.1 hypothetical protein EIN_268000 [Entamoeba invadens IP1]
MQNLDPTLTPSVLEEKIEMKKYIDRFGLPCSETLVCASKCSLKTNLPRLGKIYIFNLHVCFWPQVMKSNAEVWKFEDIAGITSQGNVLKIVLIRHEAITVSGLENSEKFIATATQHWNAYCLKNNNQITSIVSSSPTPATQLSAPSTPHKASFDGFLLSTEFQTGNEATLECSVKDFYEKFIRNEAKETYKQILTEKDIFDIAVSDFEENEKWGYLRNEEFSVPLKGIPFGPQVAKTVTQTVYFFDGDVLYLGSTNQTPEVPYGDTFRLEYKISVTPKGEKQCVFKEDFAVYFMKKTVLRSTIESQGVSNAKKDIDTMIRIYGEKISGKTVANGGDKQFMADDAPEPKFFKQSKMKTVHESTLPFTHLDFFKYFLSDKSKETQKKMLEEKGESDVEIEDWEKGDNSQVRTITTITSPNLNKQITTRSQVQQFYQLKKETLIVGSVMNYLDFSDYFTVETRMTVQSVNKTESTICFQGNIIMKKKGDEKEKDLVLKLEKACRKDVQKYIELFEEIKKDEEATQKGLVIRVSNQMTKLTFKEQMMVCHNVLLLLIFIALMGIFVKTH